MHKEFTVGHQRLRTFLATILLALAPVYLLANLFSYIENPGWEPEGGEAAGSIFLSFALLGLSVACPLFPWLRRVLKRNGHLSKSSFFGLACLVSALVCEAAFFIYPLATAMPPGNFDSSLAVPIFIAQVVVTAPFALVWQWLAKPISEGTYA